MKFEIYIYKEGTIVLIYNDNIVLISHRMSRVLDIMEDMAKNNGISSLLSPQNSELNKLFEL